MSIPRTTNQIFEEIKGVISDIDNVVGAPVTNLHGNITSIPVGEAEDQGQQWYFISTEVTEMPSLPGFVDAVSFERPGYDTVLRKGTKTVITPTLDDQTKAHMVLSSLRINGPTQYTVNVDAPGYEIAIYLDSYRLNSGREYVSSTVTISPGNRIVSVIVFGGSGPIEITTPRKISGSKTLPMPGRPFWANNPSSTYVDPQAGTLVNRLEWSNDAFAGSWVVYKANGVELGSPDGVVDNADGTFEVQWDTADYDIVAGDFLYASLWTAGRVREVVHGVNGVDPYTYVTVQLDDDALTSTSDWLAEDFFVPGEFFSTATLGFPGTSVIRFDDQDVVQDNLYFYKVTALDFLDGRSESDFSETVAVLGGDRSAPGPITVTSTSIDRDIVRITFIAPTDEDYVGVRVYGPYDSDTGISINNAPNDINDDLFEDVDRIKVEYGLPGNSDQVFFKVTDVGDYYITPCDAVGNERPPSGSYKYTFDNYDLLPPDEVTGLTAILDTADPNNVGVFPRILLDWTEPADSRFGWAEVQLSIDSGPWRSVGTEADGHMEYDGYWDATHDFRVVSVNIHDPTIKSSVGTAPTAQVITDSANSAFMGAFTGTEQYANDTPPNGYFTVQKDMDNDDIDEVIPLTTIGTLSYP